MKRYLVWTYDSYECPGISDICQEYDTIQEVKRVNEKNKYDWIEILDLDEKRFIDKEELV